MHKVDKQVYFVTVLKIAIVVFSFFLVYKRTWVGEDAFIFFRYVDNFLQGRGLVFNTGERVEGFTAPLWVFVLSFFRYVTALQLRTISIFLGYILSTSAVAILVFKSSRSQNGQKDIFLPIGTILLLTNSAFRDFATSGFETALTYFLLVLLAYTVQSNLFRSRPFIASTIASLLVLNRPETLLLYVYILVVIAIEAVKQRSYRNLLAYLVPFALLVGGYQLFRMGYFAFFFPITFYAKKGGEFYLKQGLNYTWDFFASYWFSTAMLAAGTLYALLAASNSKQKISSHHLFFMSLAALGYVLFAGGDYMHGRSLLIFYILICIFVNPYLEEYFHKVLRIGGMGFASKAVVSILLLVSVSTVAVLQKPITVIAEKQIRGIEDQRQHFGGYDFKLKDFKKYVSEPISGHFGWADQGMYFREIADAVNMPISVLMLNVGLFGYAAGDKINIMGCNLVDGFHARYPIEVRGTIGHEADQRLEYILSRRPTFAYTPFKLWNSALQYRYEKAPHGSVIQGDSNSSFIPVFDLSNTAFLKRYSDLAGADIKKNIDDEIRKYIKNLDAKSVRGSFFQTVDFLGFLNLYWKPYASAGDAKLFSQKREELFGKRILSNYEFFSLVLKPEADEMWKHETEPLDARVFVDNIKYAIKNLSREEIVVKPVIEIKNDKSLNTNRNYVSSTNVFYDPGVALMHLRPGYREGNLTIDLSRLKLRGSKYVLKINYRVVNESNSISVSSEKGGNKELIYQYLASDFGELHDVTNVYLDITKVVQDKALLSIVFNMPSGNTSFDVGLQALKIYEAL